MSHSDKPHTALLSHKQGIVLSQYKTHANAVVDLHLSHSNTLSETMSPPTPPIKEVVPLQFIINATMTVKATDAEAFLKITQETNDRALAEPECLFFNFGRREPINDLTFEPLEGGDGDEVVFWWSEGWNCTLKWYREVQFKKDYYGPHMKAVEPMWTKPRKFMLWTACWL